MPSQIFICNHLLPILKYLNTRITFALNLCQAIEALSIMMHSIFTRTSICYFKFCTKHLIYQSINPFLNLFNLWSKQNFRISPALYLYALTLYRMIITLLNLFQRSLALFQPYWIKKQKQGMKILMFTSSLYRLQLLFRILFRQDEDIFFSNSLRPKFLANGSFSRKCKKLLCSKYRILNITN